jgi:formiminotetrahydrofolate cyclodeaminase
LSVKAEKYFLKMSKSTLIEKEDAGDKNYLELPAKDLLDAFGKGSHIPGSGSAAAFSGLMAIELMKTVVQLSLSKPEYEKQKNEFELILNQLTKTVKSNFTNYFNDDIKIFHKVSYHRRLRDTAKTDEKRNEHRNLANEKLREATDIPLNVCENALDLLPTAFTIFDNGFRGARGDSGVAISNLLSAAQGSLFVVFLNLKTFQKSKWKDERMERAVNLATRFTKLQKEAYSRVVTLYNENTDSKQLTLDFYK